MPSNVSATTPIWGEKTREGYRLAHPENILTVHLVLDASGSMSPYANNLREVGERYLEFLARERPLGLWQLTTFNHRTHQHTPEALQNASLASYHASGNTALYDAVMAVCTQAWDQGQHLLVVFSDGEDNHSAHDVNAVATVLETLQREAAWVAVFLGAYPEALDVGQSMGFAPENCLVFPARDLPRAFSTLTQASGKFLAMQQQARKLLTTRSFFTET